MIKFGGEVVKLQKITIKKLHGFYDYDIEFFDKITFLHGANGSNKTTILNIISLIITGKIVKLANYEFEKIELFYKRGDIQDVILIHKEIGKIIVMFNNEKITISLFELYGYNENFNLDHFIDNKSKLDEIRRLFSYVYLPIGRADVEKIEAPMSSRLIRLNTSPDIFEDEIQFSNKKKEYKDTALQQCADLAINEIQEIRLQKERLDESFIRAMTENIITDKVTRNILQNKLNNYSYDDIDCLIKKYKEILNSQIIKRSKKNKLEQELDNIKDLFISAKETGKLSVEFALNFYKLIQAEKIVSMYDKNESYKRRISKQIDAFFNSVNEFYKKSAFPKTVYYKGNDIFFKMNDMPNLEDISLDKLSSGERQIFVLMAHIIFEVSKLHSCILVIDEPELSLHMEWQEILIDAILDSCRKTNVQLIIATHSPEIISHYGKYAKRIC